MESSALSNLVTKKAQSNRGLEWGLAREVTTRDEQTFDKRSFYLIVYKAHAVETWFEFFVVSGRRTITKSDTVQGAVTLLQETVQTHVDENEDVEVYEDERGIMDVDPGSLSDEYVERLLPLKM